MLGQRRQVRSHPFRGERGVTRADVFGPDCPCFVREPPPTSPNPGQPGRSYPAIRHGVNWSDLALFTPAIALITQRSLVQIQPPQPRKTRGYSTRCNPVSVAGCGWVAGSCGIGAADACAGPHGPDARSGRPTPAWSRRSALKIPVGVLDARAGTQGRVDPRRHLVTPVIQCPGGRPPNSPARLSGAASSGASRASPSSVLQANRIKPWRYHSWQRPSTLYERAQALARTDEKTSNQSRRACAHTTPARPGGPLHLPARGGGQAGQRPAGAHPGDPGALL
jgi:hypothetical protein